MGLRVSSTLLVLSQLAVWVAADFQNKFDNITRGSDLLLQWDQINATDYPLVIHSRLINQTSQYGANSLEVNITTELNASSFLWTGVPYPLPYFETAKYEVEIWPQNWAGSKSSAPVFASTYFTIDELGVNNSGNNPTEGFNGTTILPSKPTSQPSSSHGVNNNTAIAAGLVVPVVVILAVFGFVWTQRRQKRLIEERRKQREQLCID
ncbi:hypothetical protein F4821DRAFT_225361 [Hypoxylon rubiginosum]|uniref:Uncharacterized protein n=1 Tax=Hypoxylon rubiginosum TaxID=110542 RepID=A0ACC0DIU2_9PEZI|nr:hypothetical protein F4821DRAFT_225361 [Hypoxylon rubiginosum]